MKSFATLYKRSNQNYYGLIVGQDFQRYGITSALHDISSGDGTSQLGDDFANNHKSSFLNAYATGRYSYNDKRSEYAAAVTIRQQWARALNRDSSFFLVQPRVGFKIGIGILQHIHGSYSYQNRQPAPEIYHDRAILTGVRTLQLGLDKLTAFGTHQASVGYSYHDLFFTQLHINLTGNYSLSKRGVMVENVLDDNVLYARSIPYRGQESWSFDGSIKKSVAALRSIVELKGNFLTSNYYANNIGAAERFQSRSQQFGLLFHTGFPFPVNFNVELDANRQRTLSRERNMSQFKALRTRVLGRYRISKTMNNELTWQYYHIGGTTYHLLDNETIYRPQKGKWTFAVKARNLLDTRQLERYTVDDFSETVFRSAILGRYVIMRVSLLIQ